MTSVAPAMTARPRRVRVAIIAAISLCALGTAIFAVAQRTYWPKRFAVVEPGQIFRSGQPYGRALERVIDTHNIKTVLTFLHYVPWDEEQSDERRILEERGLRMIRIPMPGNGMGTFADLDAAADALADPANRPILAHCAAGVQRTGAALAAYRMKRCGWTWEQAMEESDRSGWPVRAKPELAEHLRRYYQTHVRASGPTSAPAA